MTPKQAEGIAQALLTDPQRAEQQSKNAAIRAVPRWYAVPGLKALEPSAQAALMRACVTHFGWRWQPAMVALALIGSTGLLGWFASMFNRPSVSLTAFMMLWVGIIHAVRVAFVRRELRARLHTLRGGGA